MTGIVTEKIIIEWIKIKRNYRISDRKLTGKLIVPIELGNWTNWCSTTYRFNETGWYYTDDNRIILNKCEIIKVEKYITIRYLIREDNDCINYLKVKDIKHS